MNKFIVYPLNKKAKEEFEKAIKEALAEMQVELQNGLEEEIKYDNLLSAEIIEDLENEAKRRE